MSDHLKLFIWVAPLVALSWLSLLSVDTHSPRDTTVAIGYLLGSSFAHATLAAAWGAFGPGPLIWRGPLSFVWALALPLAIGINFKLHGLPDDIAATLGGCLLGQWVVLQLPVWTLALGLGLRLRHVEGPGAIDAGQVRLGIRHLLSIMAIAGVVLGIVRIMAPALISEWEGPTFLFLVVAAMVVTVPLLLAALMPRRAIWGILLSLVLIAVTTACELPLMQSVGRSGPGMRHFIAINVASAFLILFVAALVRLNGYCLCIQRTEAARWDPTD